MKRIRRLFIGLIVLSFWFNVASAQGQAPTVNISVPSTPQKGDFEVTITFSRVVTEFVQDDVDVSGTGASITNWTAQTGGQVYIATFTPRERTTSSVTI